MFYPFNFSWNIFFFFATVNSLFASKYSHFLTTAKYSVSIEEMYFVNELFSGSITHLPGMKSHVRANLQLRKIGSTGRLVMFHNYMEV